MIRFGAALLACLLFVVSPAAARSLGMTHEQVVANGLDKLYVLSEKRTEDGRIVRSNPFSHTGGLETIGPRENLDSATFSIYLGDKTDAGREKLAWGLTLFRENIFPNGQISNEWFTAAMKAVVETEADLTKEFGNKRVVISYTRFIDYIFFRVEGAD